MCSQWPEGDRSPSEGLCPRAIPAERGRHARSVEACHQAFIQGFLKGLCRADAAILIVREVVLIAADPAMITRRTPQWGAFGHSGPFLGNAGETLPWLYPGCNNRDS